MKPGPNAVPPPSEHDCHVCGHWFRLRSVGQIKTRPLGCPLCDAPIRRYTKPDMRAIGVLELLGGGPHGVRGSEHLTEYSVFRWVTNEAEAAAWIGALLAIDAVEFADQHVRRIEATYASEEARRKGWSKSEDVEAKLAALELVRKQAESGLLRWRIEDLGRRVADMLRAERRHHLHIRDVRRTSKART